MWLRQDVGRYLLVRTQVLGRTEGAKALAEVEEPLMILVEVGAAGERTEWDVLVDVGIAGGVGDMFRLDPRPGRRGDDLARLCLYVAEGDLVFLAACVEVVMVDSGLLRQGRPRLVCHFAVGFRRHAHHRVAHRDVFLQAGHAEGDARLFHRVVELLQFLVFLLGVPVYALDVVA